MDDLGVPLFQETSIHMYMIICINNYTDLANIFGHTHIVGRSIPRKKYCHVLLIFPAICSWNIQYFEWLNDAKSIQKCLSTSHWWNHFGWLTSCSLSESGFVWKMVPLNLFVIHHYGYILRLHPAPTSYPPFQRLAIYYPIYCGKPNYQPSHWTTVAEAMRFIIPREPWLNPISS